MPTNQQCHLQKKLFTIENLKKLHSEIDSPTHKILQKLYIHFVLTSEILGDTISNSLIFDKEGFWLGDIEIVDFDKYAFFRFERDKAYYIDSKEEFFYRKEGLNPQLLITSF